MRNLWTLSAPVTSEYNSAMQDFTDLTYTTSPQHKDSTEARIKKRCIWSRENSDKACSLLTLHIWSYSEKHCQRDSGWTRCECTWLWIGCEHDHWRYNRKVGIYLQIQAERQSPNPWEYLCCEDCSWSYHWSFCSSVSLWCQGQKIFPLKRFWRMN